MLEVSNLSAGYLGEPVVHGLTLAVQEAEAVTIIGTNGAGKTTFFRAICGILDVVEGSVHFDGSDVTGLPTHRLARAGLAYVPAERHLFPQMTVEENLALGAYPSRPDSSVQSMIWTLFPRLAERSRQRAGTMSGGEQQMLAVGRALMAKPRLLLLDEPTTGLAPNLAAEAYLALAELKSQGLTLLVTEQQVPLALSLCDRGYVLENGRFELAGTAAELAANPDVRRAYLGVA